MNSDDLKTRTQKFALDIIKMCSSLPDKQEYKIIKNQLIRCSSSVGANYRAVCRAKSIADFINKLKIVEEEADESVYWLELLKELGIKNLNEIMNEANEIISIIVASIKTAKKRN
ncbi:MAG: four helix bundle protein [Bacteroidales bacterium]|nr:four helix bundle protein [Bacteroidales bacterium]